MGRFIYDSSGPRWEMQDRLLVHLQAAVTVKFRRGESFALNLGSEHVPAPDARRVFWMHPSIPVQFARSTRGTIPLNISWVDALVAQAGTEEGLKFVPEPPDHPLTKPALTG